MNPMPVVRLCQRRPRRPAAPDVVERVVAGAFRRACKLGGDMKTRSRIWIAAAALLTAAAVTTTTAGAAEAATVEETVEVCRARLKQLTVWARAEQGLGTVEAEEAQAVADNSSRLRASGIDGHHNASVIGVISVDDPCDVSFEAFLTSPPHRRWVFDADHCGMGWGVVADAAGAYMYIAGDFINVGPEACALDEDALAGWPPVHREAIRVSGRDRYRTAARLSERAFEPGVAAAFIATGEDYPDALAAGPAAAKLGGPVLLTKKAELPEATVGELTRLKPRMIVVVGGETVVSPAVENTLRRHAATVRRVAGADRYETAAKVAAAFFEPGVAVAYVATGEDYPDALAAGAAAAKRGGPVLLTRKDSLPPSTEAELRRLRSEWPVVVGGPEAVSPIIEWKIGVAARDGDGIVGAATASGADRYETAAVVVRQVASNLGYDTMYIATGDDYPDALTAGPAAAAVNGHVLLVPARSMPKVVDDELARLQARPVVVVGGPGAVSDRVKKALDRRVAATFAGWSKDRVR